MKKLILVLTLLLSGCATNEETVEINVYTDRHYEVDKEVYEQFEEETGIKINLVELDAAEIYSRLSNEKDTVADIVVMTGSEYIYKMNEKELLVNHNLTPSIDNNYYGDNWIGIVARARSVAISNDSDITISSYQDLASSEYENKVLVRSSNSAYNQAWVASLISLYGEEEIVKWLDGFVNNFARSPEGNDRDQVKAINGGEGEIAIVNSYYMNRMHNSSEASEVEASNNVHLANLDEIQFNISWVGMVDNNEATTKLVQFLTSAQTGSKISLENGEYPLHPDSVTNEYINDLQVINVQDIDYETFGMYVEKAYELMVEAGWR